MPSSPATVKSDNLYELFCFFTSLHTQHAEIDDDEPLTTDDTPSLLHKAWDVLASTSICLYGLVRYVTLLIACAVAKDMISKSNLQARYTYWHDHTIQFISLWFINLPALSQFLVALSLFYFMKPIIMGPIQQLSEKLTHSARAYLGIHMDDLSPPTSPQRRSRRVNPTDHPHNQLSDTFKRELQELLITAYENQTALTDPKVAEITALTDPKVAEILMRACGDALGKNNLDEDTRSAITKLSTLISTLANQDTTRTNAGLRVQDNKSRVSALVSRCDDSDDSSATAGMSQ